MHCMEPCALFIDVENIAYFLKPRIHKHDLVNAVCEAIRNLEGRLQERSGVAPIIQSAYGDFERLDVGFLRTLFLMGIEAHNVVGTDHKNAADMGLCIEAMETLYTRPEIRTFVLVAGDRDYIPLVQHLRRSGRDLHVCSIRPITSGDLLNLVAENRFIDALELVPDHIREAVENYVEPEPVIEPKKVKAKPTAQAELETPLPIFEKSVPIDDDATIEAILTLFSERFLHRSEIWLKPYLTELQQSLGHLADYERRALIGNMEQHGAIAIEKREGDEHQFSVILVNYDHPTIQKYHPG